MLLLITHLQVVGASSGQRASDGQGVLLADAACRGGGAGRGILVKLVCEDLCTRPHLLASLQGIAEPKCLACGKEVPE